MRMNIQKTDIKIAAILLIPILASLFISDSIPLYGIIIIFSIAWTIRYPEFAAAVFLTESFLFTAYFNLFELDGLSLTIMVLSILLIGMITRFFRTDPDTDREYKPVVSLFFVLVIGALLAFQTLYSPSRAYAFQKTVLYFYFNVLFFLIPYSFFSSKKSIEAIYRQGSIIGILLIFIGTIIVFSEGFSDRFDPSGRGNVIWFARVIGLSIIFFYFSFQKADTRIKKYLYLFLIFSALIFINIAGSRGPLVSLAGTFLVYGILFYKTSYLKKIVFSISVTIALIGGAYLILPQIMSRFTSLSGDASGLLRIYSAEQAWNFFLNSPIIGHGTGSFKALVNETLEYPHNIFLELGMENGLLMLSIFVGFIGYVFYNLVGQRNAAADQNDKYLFNTAVLIFLFGFFNAQFSGDIAHNPILWFSAGIIYKTKPSAVDLKNET